MRFEPAVKRAARSVQYSPSLFAQQIYREILRNFRMGAVRVDGGGGLSGDTDDRKAA